MSALQTFNAVDFAASDDFGSRFLGTLLNKLEVNAECLCHRCIAEKNIQITNWGGFRLDSAVMIICPQCGNKRCPHASDHRLSCTSSNDSG